MISAEKQGKNGVEVIVFNGIKWLNENNIEDKLKHSNLPAATLQYPSELRKQRQELQNCGKYQPCRGLLEEDFEIQIIMDCRTIPAVNFKTRSGFKQHDPTMTQERSILSKIVALFAAEEIILQHNVLGYRIDAYFPKHKLAIEADEQRHNSRNIDYEIERQKELEKELNCKFIRINPAKENFNIFVEIGKIHSFIVKSTKKTTKKSLIDELSNKLSQLEIRSNNPIKYVVKKILPTL